MSTAKELVDRLGTKLVGMLVDTVDVGDYPGGEATVTEIHPDPGAPEISFNVRNDDWEDDDGENTIGIFEDEEVELIP